MNFTGILIIILNYRLQTYLNKAVDDLMKKLYFEWANRKKFTVAFFNFPEIHK